MSRKKAMIRTADQTSVPIRPTRSPPSFVPNGNRDLNIVLELPRAHRPKFTLPRTSVTSSAHDELGKFSQRRPVHVCAAGFDLRGSFLFDRRDHNFVALRAGSIEHQERKSSVACDDAEFGVGRQFGLSEWSCL